MLKIAKIRYLISVLAAAIFIVVPALAVAQKQIYTIPSREKMKWACKKTGGKWRELPKYCDNMHPRNWHKLNPEQKITCYNNFHEPCDCGVGRRFVIYNRLGCVTSNFPEDYWY